MDMQSKWAKRDYAVKNSDNGVAVKNVHMMEFF